METNYMGVMWYVCVPSFIPICVTLACYNDKQFYQETLPEAICCCLQTYLLLIFILLIEYFIYIKLSSRSSYHL